MKRALIVRLSALGDVIGGLPAATALARAFPGIEIEWVVDPRFAGVVECCTAVSKVTVWKPSLSPQKWPRYGEGFDAVIDLQGLLKSSLAGLRAKAPQRIGYHRQREGSRFFSRAILPDPSSLHIVDQYLDVVRALGTDDVVDFGLVPNTDDAVAVAGMIGEGRPAIAINPNAGRPIKEWPTERWASLIKLASKDFRFVLLGTKGEAEKSAAIQAACPDAEFVDLTGKTSVRQLVAVLDRCVAHVAGDTGTSHLAGAMKKPAIALYAVTDPLRFSPYGQAEHCFRERRGVGQIEPEAVYRKLVEVLG